MWCWCCTDTRGKQSRRCLLIRRDRSRETRATACTGVLRAKHRVARFLVMLSAASALRTCGRSSHFAGVLPKERKASQPRMCGEVAPPNWRTAHSGNRLRRCNPGIRFASCVLVAPDAPRHVLHTLGFRVVLFFFLNYEVTRTSCAPQHASPLLRRTHAKKKRLPRRTLRSTQECGLAFSHRASPLIARSHGSAYPNACSASRESLVASSRRTVRGQIERKGMKGDTESTTTTNTQKTKHHHGRTPRVRAARQSAPVATRTAAHTRALSSREVKPPTRTSVRARERLSTDQCSPHPPA